VSDAPLSFAQQQLWFIDRLVPHDSAYNFDLVMDLGGEVDTAALRCAFQRIVARHHILRTIFHIGADGVPFQRAVEDFELPFDVVDLSSLPAAASRNAADALVREWAGEPFDLERGPLVRVRLVRVGDREHVLGVFLHHAVVDGWSTEVLFRELAHYYAPNREPGALPPPTVRYADYARRQRELLSGDRLTRQLQWWQDYLRGAPTTLALGDDSVERGSSRGARVVAELPAATIAGVSAIARTASATPFMVLLAAYAVLLGQHTGARDVLIGTQVAGRPRRELHDLIGLFANTIPIRVDLGAPRTFAELVAHVRESTLDALAHDEVPLDRIVDAVSPNRTVGSIPLVQTVFAGQLEPPPVPELSGLSVRPRTLAATTSKFDVGVAVQAKAGGGHEVALTYRTGTMAERTALDLVRRYRGLLAAAVEAPDTDLRRLAAHAPRGADTPSGTALEDVLAGIWREVLHNDHLTVHDNFFDAGGQSLTMAIVHARMERELGRELPMVAFYEHPTIAALAAHLSGRAAPSTAPNRPPDRRRSPSTRSRQHRRAARGRGE
jgi:hypothetical protein